jgi:hypothetical protein
MEIGFDLIGDLNLDPEENFNWEGKATSLYCLVAGNVSEDLRTVQQTLSHLSRFYQGIFYVPGLLEFKTAASHESRTKEIALLVKRLPKVALLYHHVVIIDGVAILGANGWSADDPDDIDMQLIKSRLDDIAYLNKSVAKLQTHGDVKRILVLTACVPHKQLYFGKVPEHVDDHIYPDYCFQSDTEMKITHWAFGGSNTITNTVFRGVTYINNPYNKDAPYWPTRIGIEV